MKRSLYYILGVCLFLVGCGMEMSDNGDLDGFWQLHTLEALDGSGQVKDMRTSGQTWAFQGKILELRSTWGGKVLMFSFNHVGDSLLLSNPYIIDRDSGDIKIDDTRDSLYRDFGIHHADERFRILQLNSSTAIFESAETRVHLRKY